MKLLNLLASTAIVVSLGLSGNALAQETSNYDYVEAFNPYYYTKSSNEFRSASSKPSPKYRQNSVDYKISASLADQKREITARVTMSYTNNSPDQLDFLWLQHDKNMFSDNDNGTAI